MKAKDTVMRDDGIVEIIRVRKKEIFSKPDAWASYRFIAEAQAEITWDIAFKAGFEEGRMLHIET